MVPVSWDEVIPLLANEYTRVIAQYGNTAIYGGSYGWASAGRFHHAQSQLHRFLNVLGGYVSHVNTYSNAAGEVILDRVVGNMRELIFKATSWEAIAAESDLVLAFGGLPVKNSFVSPGGSSRHPMRDCLISAAERGCQFVYFSPCRDDLLAELNGEWHAPIPGTDVALMLAMAWVLESEGLVDHAFLGQYTVGYEQFRPYLLGTTDGVPKTPEWAESISGIPAQEIESIARRLPKGRTLINTSWSLQRRQHGEQAPWMALVLAAMVGQIGLPGGGYGFGYASMSSIGEDCTVLARRCSPSWQIRSRSTSRSRAFPICCLNPANSSTTTASDLPIRTFDLSTGPAAIRSTIIRIWESAGCPWPTVIVNEPYWTSWPGMPMSSCPLLSRSSGKTLARPAATTSWLP